MEFMDILDKAQDVRGELSDDYEEAQKKINMARAMEGTSPFAEQPPRYRSTRRSPPSRKHHGRRRPQIESSRVSKSLDERGYGIMGTSARIDEAAEAYEDLLESIILAAEVETAMKKMLREIETTKRRVNALEFKLLPELYENQEYIEQKLEEQEREETFRLKKIKEKKEQEEREEREAEADAAADEPEMEQATAGGVPGN
ncbi:V-type ATP synthase subunit D [Natrialba swarupiae]|nr:V-type ATP synthase subunit D [Natrialba swarupiae]